MKNLVKATYVVLLSSVMAWCQEIRNEQCIGPNIGTGSLYIQKTVACVPFTVRIDKTDENTSGNQYIFNYTGGPPTNLVTEKTHTYTTPGAYRLMQVSFRKDNGQELRACTTITVLDTAKIEISPNICENRVSLLLSDVRKNGTIQYDFCYIDWGDGSATEKINLPSGSIVHEYANRSDKKIKVRGGYLVDDCGGSNSVLIKFPVFNEPVIKELQKLSSTQYTLTFENQTGDDFNILANGQVFQGQKGKIGTQQVSFYNPSANACYSIQMQRSCYTNPISKEICDVNFQFEANAGGNLLTWLKPAPEIIRNTTLIKNTSLKIPVRDIFYNDEDISCNQENCYQLQFMSNESLFTSQSICAKNGLIPCEHEIEVYVPSVFSPNGDGINDKLMLSGQAEKFISLKIMDRREYVVAMLYSLNDTWDGANQQPGVYFYVLTVKNNNNKEKTLQGSITLFR
ncbi:gliding motility-associated C-terminal domain-containing protein [Emticicia sp. 17c]|uniref:T9SS type B sorting domain-containing protein n=1 Tax=Emticicia sp. 17c TaxID=3127704 RepID=UPI00301CF843